MLLFKSNIITANFLEVQFLTHIKIQNEKGLTIEKLKEDLNNMCNKMVKRKGRHIFVDVTEVSYLFDNERIKWFNNSIIDSISSIKCDKIAWIFNESLQNYPSLDTKANEKIEQKIFTHPKEAMNWLIEGADRKKLRFQK